MDNSKVCLSCAKPLEGRSDKKFCNDQCRSTYNNTHKNSTEQLILTVNQILRKNRTILKSLNPSGKSVVHRGYLDEKDFDFTYFTHIYKTKVGDIYYFCYDIGYYILDEDNVRIVESQAYMKS